MQRLLLTIRFDGTHYHGWQVQKNAVSVQQKMQDAVEKVTGVRSGIIGCSRTDAGVHADMYCCTFDTDSSLRGNSMASALNANLPSDIAVYNCCEVPIDFHPRYSAVGKRYIYYIWNSPARNPFWEKYALHLRRPLDHDLLNKAASDFIGKHDFASFCAAGSSVKDTVRNISHCSVTRDGELVVFSVEGDGFLYNMVRIMVGTLLEIASGKRSDNCIRSIISAKNRSHAGATAPAKALFLNKVFYE
jgi:tRNA pseudouridine38-40 synthase